jgi:predicted dehydrogenase
MADQVRWGILGAARIAAKSFLPAVAEAGGVAAAVAGRDERRTAGWAQVNGVGRVLDGYQQLLDDPQVDAVYIPLPNSLHAEWTIKALRAGKAVLCEKPLTASVAEAEQVLAVAAETGVLLWEAFVFPFHDQMSRIRALLGEGVIGEPQEIQSTYHFSLTRPDDIRLSAELAGGSLNDVGCYPVMLGRHLFAIGQETEDGQAADHDTARAAAVYAPSGVDLATWGWLGFPGERRLLLSCGFQRAQDTFSRLAGTAGQINITGPFHPTPADTFEVCLPGRDPVTHRAAGRDEYSFTPAIRHIQAAVAGREAPRYLAVDTSLGQARALQDLSEAAALSRDDAW